MSVAVVTITCPKCGGDVKGVEASGTAQKIPCTYCGAELHVPQIGVVQGAEVPRRHIVETAQSSASTRSRTTALLFALVGAGILLVMIALDAPRSEDPLAKLERRAAAQKKCEQECRESCQKAPRPLSSIPLQHRSADIERTLQHADVVMCETECESTRQCWNAE